MNVPDNVCQIENSQSGLVLPISHVQVFLEIVCFRVPDIRTIEKRAEEEESEDGQDSVLPISKIVSLLRCRGVLREGISKYLRSSLSRSFLSEGIGDGRGNGLSVLLVWRRHSLCVLVGRHFLFLDLSSSVVVHLTLWDLKSLVARAGARYLKVERS